MGSQMIGWVLAIVGVLEIVAAVAIWRAVNLRPDAPTDLDDKRIELEAFISKDGQDDQRFVGRVERIRADRRARFEAIRRKAPRLH